MMNQSLGFQTDEKGKWGYCLRHLLAMHCAGAPEPRISLFFSSGYVVIRATKLEAVWEALLAGEPDIQARSAEFGIQSILPRAYRPPKNPDEVDGG